MPNEKLQKELEPLFNLKPEKAIEYFTKKATLGPEKHWDWTDTMNQSHDKVFVVAKATCIDLVKDIKKSISKAIEEGKPYQDFANELIPILKKRGWWGNIDAENKDQGIVKPIRVDHRRLRNIYNTNVKTAYAAGRYEQMKDEADIAPYWRYVAVPKGAGNKNPRVEHAALHNLVFRHDDPFWQTHYAPNGWGCHCTVVNMTKRALEKKFGKKAEEVVRKSKPEDFVTTTEEFEREHVKIDGTVEMQKVKITTTGYKVGGKVIYPSQGWDYTPGSYSYQCKKMLESKISELPSKEKRTMLSQLAENIRDSFSKMIEMEDMFKKPVGNYYAAGLLDESMINVLNTKKTKNGRVMNIQSGILTISDRSILHALRNEPGHDPIPKEILKNLPDIINEWECSYNREEGLIFWKEIQNNDSKLYKIVFQRKNAVTDEFSLKTAYLAPKASYRQSELIRKNKKRT